MWTDNGRILRDLIKVAETSVGKLGAKERLGDVERIVSLALKNACYKGAFGTVCCLCVCVCLTLRAVLKKRADVIVIAFYGGDTDAWLAKRRTGGPKGEGSEGKAGKGGPKAKGPEKIEAGY